MNYEQFDKLNELARRAREVGKTSITLDYELTDDYFHVTKLNPSEQSVTITKSDGDFLEEFPITSLDETIIRDILIEAEDAIADEEAEIEKVFDNNHWANV
jgi:hypothetical protein